MDIHSSKAKDKEYVGLYGSGLCNGDLPTNCYIRNSASISVWEHAPPGECFKLGALRSNLVLFQTKSYDIISLYMFYQMWLMRKLHKLLISTSFPGPTALHPLRSKHYMIKTVLNLISYVSN